MIPVSQAEWPGNPLGPWLGLGPAFPLDTCHFGRIFSSQLKYYFFQEAFPGFTWETFRTDGSTIARYW